MSTDTAAPRNALDPKSRLHILLTRLERMLSERYAFDVFAKDSINFGFLATYRQTWGPQGYQVGDLITTIPLAPREIRRYTTRTVTKRTRAVKELEDNLQNRRSDRTDTSRADAEIVAKAQTSSTFTLTASETLGGEAFSINSTQSAGTQQGKQSERVKKEFRESVLKSAEEYKQQHRVEIDTTESTESEETTFHELQNPNEELTVTYLFYELQRTYRLAERIHKLTPVVLVANDVPAPHEIDDAWLVAHDWILRRCILDDSFRPAISYLTESFVGAETNIRILEANAVAQRRLVDALQQRVRGMDRILAAGERDVLDAVRDLGDRQQEQGLIDIVKRVFDPIGITGGADTGKVSAADLMLDYAKEARDRAERERARVAAQAEVAVTALQAAVDRLSLAVREHYDKVAEIDRLRLHVKDNILFYMQVVWDLEPPDQRYFRLYDVEVPDIHAGVSGVTVQLRESEDVLDVLLGRESATVELPMPDVTVTRRKLVEIADLDTVLGYKGNYAIYALKENSYLTLRMMQDYLDVGDQVRARDPDGSSGYSVEELRELAACLHSANPRLYSRHRDAIRRLLIERIRASKGADEFVVVPTSSIYIEALVGTHPLLEDFKLIHRALDVKRVQAEVRHAELENIRLAARALRGNDEDPDIDRKVVVEGVPVPVVLDTDAT